MQILARGERRYRVSATMAARPSVLRRLLRVFNGFSIVFHGFSMDFHGFQVISRPKACPFAKFELYRNRLVDLLAKKKSGSTPKLRSSESGMQAGPRERRENGGFQTFPMLFDGFFHAFPR